VFRNFVVRTEAVLGQHRIRGVDSTGFWRRESTRGKVGEGGEGGGVGGRKGEGNFKKPRRKKKFFLRLGREREKEKQEMEVSGPGWENKRRVITFKTVIELPTINAVEGFPFPTAHKGNSGIEDFGIRRKHPIAEGEYPENSQSFPLVPAGRDT